MTLSSLDLFDQSPALMLVIDLDFCIVSVTNSFLKIIKSERENIVGRDIFNVFPTNPHDKIEDPANEMLASLQRVHKNKKSDTLELQKYHIPKPISEGGGFEVKYWKVVNSPILDQNNEIKYIIQHAEDVTVKNAYKKQLDIDKKTLDKIKTTEKHINKMRKQSPFAFAIMKGENKVITNANDLMKDFLGMELEIENKELQQILPELKDQSFNLMIDKVYNTGQPIYLNEIKSPLLKKGILENRYFNMAYLPYYDTNATIKGVIMIAYDVSATILSKLKTEESEHKFRTLIEEASVPTAFYEGPDLRLQYANDIMWKSWGKKKTRLNTPLIEILPEIKDQPFISHLNTVYSSGIPYICSEEKTEFFINGTLQTFYFNVSYKALRNKTGEIYGVHEMAINVTNEVLTKIALEESEKRYKALIKATATILWRSDRIGNFLEDQSSWEEYTGQNLENYKDLGWKNMIHEKYRPKVYQDWQDAMLQKSEFHSSGKMWCKKYDEYRYFEITGIPFFEENGNIKEWMGAIKDVHEQKIAIKKLEYSEQRFHEMIYSSPSLIAIFKGEDMIIDMANDPIIKSWGKGKNIIGKSVFMVIPELIEQGIDKILRDVYKNGTPFYAYEMPIQLINNGQVELRHYTFTCQAQRNINGKIEGVAILANEVTSQALLNKKIKDSEERFRLLVMQAPLAICLLRGEKYVIEALNKRMAEMWNKNIDHILNKPFFDVITDLNNVGLKLLLDRVYRTGERFVADELPITIERNGKTEDVFIKFVYEPLLDSDHTISGVMAIALEITDQVLARKKIEESEKQFRLLMDTMPQKINTTDAEGRITFFNQQWLSDTDLTFEELREQGWKNTLHEYDLDNTIKKWKQSLKTGEMFEAECRIKNKDGKYKWHLCRAIPIKNENGEITMWVGSNTDIQNQKEEKNKAEADKQIAEDAVKSKQQFLANMSHEIRTPMNAIIGFTNVILKTELSKKQKEYIHAIKVSGDSLIILINDILDIAKVDAGKMTFEYTPFKLSDSINAIVLIFEGKFQEKNLELIQEYDDAIPDVIIGDAMRLRQIIINLLSNSLKFTETGKITLGIRMLKEDEDRVTLKFEVIDTGIGIAQNKLELIFENFQQAAKKTTRLHGGTGLGLSIAKKLVELQDGVIWVKSEEGKGSTFAFVLNFEKTKIKIKVEKEIELKLNDEIKNAKVLVVEDIPLNQLLMKTILMDFGYELDIADNGKIAVEKVQKNKYDIILMDLQMPEMDGFDATTYIRNTLKSKTPIIALTADVTEADIKKCTTVGMNDYVSKPIDEKALFDKMEKFLRKPTLQSELEPEPA